MNTTLFETKPPCPPVRFKYLEFWKIVTSSGKVYKDVKLIGPRNADDAFSAALVVRFTQLVIPGMGLERVVEDTVARKSKLPGFMITSRSSLELAQHEAESIEFSYTLTQKLISQFEKQFGSVNCRQLIGCDLLTEAGQRYFMENAVMDHCLQYAQAATSMAISLIAEFQSSSTT